MSKIKTADASDVDIVGQIVSVKHLFNRLSSSSHEAALFMVLPFAVLAERPRQRRAFLDDMSVLVAAVADCPLRALVDAVVYSQAVLAGHLIEAGVVVMTDFLAPEATHVTLEVTVYLLFVLFLLVVLSHHCDLGLLLCDVRLQG